MIDKNVYEKDKDMDEDEFTHEKREEHDVFQEKHEEITAAAEVHRRRKEFEIFFGM
jgi:hypothetical protein